jgi:predicted Zn finger-like uncharacterized protein
MALNSSFVSHCLTGGFAAMSVPVECPACKHSFAVPDEYAGKLGKCPKCGDVFRAPNAAAAAKDATKLPTAKPLVEVASPPTPRPPKKTATAETPPAVRPPVAAQATPVAPQVARATPQVALVTPQSAPASPFPAFDAASPGQPGSSAITRHAGRGKSNSPMLWVAAGGGGVLVIVAVAAVAVLGLSGNSANSNPSVANNSDDTKDAANVNVATNSPDQPVKEPVAAAPTKLSQAELDKLWSNVHRRIVRLTAQTPSGPVTGTGFVVDSRGWVATNYHLIQDANSVAIQFAPDLDGTPGFSMPASGTIAVKREHDLAVLKLAPESTLTFTELTLQADSQPQAGETLVACGLPPDNGSPLTECSVKQVIASVNLPPNTKTALRDRNMGDSSDLSWIEHTAIVDEQSQGGPLLNARGEVVGIDTQLSRASTGGYAIHVKHLSALLAGASDENVKLFEPPKVASVDTPTFNIPPLVKPEPVPEPEPVPLGPAELSVAGIVKLHEECKAMNWNPTTQAQYGRLQELSRLVNEAKSFEEDASQSADLRQQLGAAAQTVLMDLAATAWRTESQIAAVNKLAAKGLESPGDAVFVYARVVIPSTRSGKFNGKPTVILEMVGTGDLMVMPVTENAAAMEPASRWLVLGLHDPQVQFTLTIDDSPAKTAAVIVPKYVVGAPQ